MMKFMKLREYFHVTIYSVTGTLIKIDSIARISWGGRRGVAKGGNRVIACQSADVFPRPNRFSVEIEVYSIYLKLRLALLIFY